MKPFDDQDLIAFHLHELSPRKARALERALQTDASLAAESEAYAVMLRAFKGDIPLNVDEQVLARNWNALRPSLAAHPVRPAARPRWHIPALAGVGLAFAGTSIFLATRRYNAIPHPQTSYVRQASDNTQPVPHTKGPDIQNAPAAAFIRAPKSSASEERSSVIEQDRTARIFAPDFPANPQGTLPRRIAPVWPASELAAAPHLIPLASVSVPALPEAPPPFLTVESAASLQATDKQKRARSKQGRHSVPHEHQTDLTLAMGGTLIGTRDAGSFGTGTLSQGATHAVSAIAAFHQQLRPAVGYRIAVSYTRPDFQYSYQDAGQWDIASSVYELAATYVIQGPHRGALSTSAEAGAGIMGFLPAPQRTSTSYNLHAAAVVGIAAEYALTKHVALHAAYRAQAFQGPEFKYNGVTIPTFSTTLFSNEPMVGITYRFHHK